MGKRARRDVDRAKGVVRDHVRRAAAKMCVARRDATG